VALLFPTARFSLFGDIGESPHVAKTRSATNTTHHRLYYLDPFNYLMSSLMVFTTWDKPVNCRPNEVALFDPPAGQTCAEYMQAYQNGMGRATNLLNPNNTAACQVCQYTTGADYLLNLDDKYYGWRNAGLVVVFVVGIYGLVYLMMKLRTKQTKKAES
jgi:ABC-type multidrug transport system permease subunit